MDMLTPIGIKNNYKPLHLMPEALTRGAAGEADPLSENLKDYLAAVTTMTGAAGVVSTQNLFFSFNTPPSWYNDENKEKIANLKAHANVWGDSILPRLKSVPKTLLNYDSQYTALSLTIKTAVFVLLNEKTSAEDRKKNEKSLLEGMEVLVANAEAQKELVKGLIEDMENLLSDFREDKKFAADLSAKALEQKDVNEKNVEGMKKELENLDDELKEYQGMVTKGGIGLGVSVTVGFIGLAGGLAGLPFMWVGFVVGVLGTLASVGVMIAASVNISKTAQKIAEQSMKIGRAEADAVYCGQLEKACGKVCTALENGIHALTGISSVWETLQQSMDGLVATINSGNEQAKKKLYEDLRESMDASDEQWKAIVAQAGELDAVNIEVEKKHIMQMTMDDGKLKVA